MLIKKHAGMFMAKIVIDAGHGGRDPGAVWDGRQEKDDSLALALAVGEKLADRGVDVVYTRTEDIYQTPFEKAQISNRENPDFFVSIHRNSSPEANQYTGVETLVYDRSGSKERMAENINRELEKEGFKNLGVKERPGLVVLRRTSAPALLVEAGFINSDEDDSRLDSRFDRIAQAIADGVLRTLEEEEKIRPEYYQIQVGAYVSRQVAEEITMELMEQGYPAFYIYQDGYYKVLVGAFLNLDNGANIEMRLRQNGWPTMMVLEPAVY